jgi:ATP-dependent protease ClpP protease subunit
MADDSEDRVPEIAIVGELTEAESGLMQSLLDVPPGGECLLYFDSPGGSPYCGMSLMTTIRLRGLKATGIVVGECSSAALWPFAACHRRLVTPLSVLLFHPMRWQSEENVGLPEAAEWARHFAYLEGLMDRQLADMLPLPLDRLASWTRPGRYITGAEIAEAGIAELVGFESLFPAVEAKPKGRGGRKR